MKSKIPMLLVGAGLTCLAGCGPNERQEEYCDRQQLPCKSRDQMAKDFTYWDGTGEIVSIDDGPRLKSDWGDGTGICCYNVTYRPEYDRG